MCFIYGNIPEFGGRIMRIGLVGFGVVGRGVYDLTLDRNDIQIAHVLCLEDVTLPGVNVTRNFDDILQDDTVDTVIEAMGGLHPAWDFVKKAIEFGAIPAYAYLGDVGDSVTGDKKAQKFEDDFLPELIKEIKAIGFKAVAYMPTRNTPAQLERISGMCTRFSGKKRRWRY